MHRVKSKLKDTVLKIRNHPHKLSVINSIMHNIAEIFQKNKFRHILQLLFIIIRLKLFLRKDTVSYNILNIKQIEAKDKTKEKIYLWNIKEKKYITYNKKSRTFKTSDTGVPFDLKSNYKGDVTLMYKGKYMHSNIFNRNLTLAGWSILHDHNQVLTVKYAGNSMYKLNFKFYCVGIYKKSLYEYWCKGFDSAQDQYFYLVPKSFYQRHVKWKNRMFSGYNADIGACMATAAIHANSMHSLDGNAGDSQCGQFNGGHINGYVDRNNMGGGQYGNNMPGGGMNMFDTGGQYGHHMRRGHRDDNSSSSSDSSNISNKDLKKVMLNICRGVSKRRRHRSNNYDSSSSISSSDMYGGRHKYHKMRGVGMSQFNNSMALPNSYMGGMNGMNCFANGQSNPYLNNMSTSNLSSSCMPIYGNDMYMRGTPSNSQYGNNLMQNSGYPSYSMNGSNGYMTNSLMSGCPQSQPSFQSQGMNLGVSYPYNNMNGMNYGQTGMMPPQGNINFTNVGMNQPAIC